jgi:hypothetical protein
VSNLLENDAKEKEENGRIQVDDNIGNDHHLV